MNQWSDFERLMDVARGEPIPSIDVTAQVLAQIQATSARTSGVASQGTAGSNGQVLRHDADDRMELLVGTVIAVVAASVALMLALPTWEAMNDPYAGWLQAYQMVLQ